MLGSVCSAQFTTPPRLRHRVRMEIVPGPCPEALPIGETTTGPLFVGDGHLNYVCANCFAVLCQGIAPGDLEGIVLRCSCGAINRVPRSH